MSSMGRRQGQLRLRSRASAPLIAAAALAAAASCVFVVVGAQLPFDLWPSDRVPPAGDERAVLRPPPAPPAPRELRLAAPAFAVAAPADGAVRAAPRAPERAPR